MQDIPERSQAKTLATFCDNIIIHIVASFVLFYFEFSLIIWKEDLSEERTVA